MKLLLCFIFSVGAVALAQSTKVGGRCEGCEAIYEYGNKQLSWTDTLPDFAQSGPKLKIEGTVYQRDEKTPAAGVILYIYHTDQKGVYPTRGNESGWARRHGYLRGWVKTGADGRYQFLTLKPAAYPSRTEPAHIHLTVKEPGKNEYWLDSYLFDDDPLVTPSMKEKKGRGGSGIVKTVNAGKILVAKRDLILGLNVPNYK